MCLQGLAEGLMEPHVPVLLLLLFLLLLLLVPPLSTCQWHGSMG